jgi:hypothetical protein
VKAGILPLSAAVLAYYYLPVAAFATPQAQTAALALFRGMTSPATAKAALTAALMASSAVPAATAVPAPNLSRLNLSVFGLKKATTVNGVTKQIYTNGKDYYANIDGKTWRVYPANRQNVATGMFTAGKMQSNIKIGQTMLPPAQ